MSIFLFIAVIVPIIIASVVPLVLHQKDYKLESRYRWLLYIACGLFFISWFLPSPLINGQDTSFTTHFVGGGLFSGLLWCYLKFSLKWRSHWLVEAFSLFALVSALGCINELAELGFVQFGLSSITLDDTNWDILANSLGSLMIYLIYLILRKKS